MKLLNKAVYSDMILAQECTVCFWIVEETKIKSNKYVDARNAWMKPSKIFSQPQVIPRQ